MTALLEFWYSILAIFNSFDPITYAFMAIIVIGAGVMMPNITSLITATFVALMVFALAVFGRAAIVARDAGTLARSDWNDLLALPLHTLSLYVFVFAFAIIIVHTLLHLAKR